MRFRGPQALKDTYEKHTGGEGVMVDLKLACFTPTDKAV
jgi:hypothetical protein